MDSLAAEYQKIADYWVECKIKGDSFYLGTIQEKIRLRLEKSNYRSRTCPIFKGAIAVQTEIFSLARGSSPLKKTLRASGAYSISIPYLPSKPITLCKSNFAPLILLCSRSIEKLTLVLKSHFPKFDLSNVEFLKSQSKNRE